MALTSFLLLDVFFFDGALAEFSVRLKYKENQFVQPLRLIIYGGFQVMKNDKYHIIISMLYRLSTGGCRGRLRWGASQGFFLSFFK